MPFPIMQGLFTCPHALSPAGLPRAAAFVKANGLCHVLTPQHLVIEFADGCDALFIPVTPDGHPDPADAIAMFQRLNQGRQQVLDALRRHAAQSDIALGDLPFRWSMQWSGNATSEIAVGTGLTRLLATREPADALVELLQRSWMPRLTRDAAAARIADLTPFTPVRWRSSDEATPLLGPGILALDCQVLGQDTDLPRDPTALADTLAPTRHSPGQLAVNQVVEQVGLHRFSLDLAGHGEAQIRFTDGHDDYLLHPRSRRLARAIDRDGLGPTVQRLVADFRRLDEARSQALALVESQLGQAGYAVDESGGTWWLGRTHREFSIEVGRPLTLALRHAAPHDWFRRWLERSGVSLPEPLSSVAARESTASAPLRRRTLAAHPPSTNSPIPALDSLDPVHLDALAHAAIGAARRQAERDPGRSLIGGAHDLLDLWAGPFWYRSNDLWADESWWRQLARDAWDRHRHQGAAMLLCHHRELPADADFRAAFHEHDAWNQECFIDGLLWLYQEFLPWPIDDDALPEFPSALGPRPPQVCWRASRTIRTYLSLAPGGLDGDAWFDAALRAAAALDPSAATVWLSAAQLGEFAGKVRERVVRAEFPDGPDLKPLCAAAAALGWSWVPDQLEANPSFLPAQFALEETYAEPGMTALQLSWVLPGPLAARFAARALTPLDPDLLEQRARTFAGSQAMLEAGRQVVRDWIELDQFAAAIAWQRCRAAAGAPPPHGV